MSLGPVLRTKIPESELKLAISKGHAQFFFRPSYILKTIIGIKSLKELIRITKGAHSVIKGKILYNLSKNPEKKQKS